ncbi:hypothetical protein PanWU01x14_170810 [Parasponia andersonii]|uniref:Uncharacterized protein n=1 Tax=Parasponia andersonii TaxID=3476 RepID=A0A2P5CA02_PARAD|nr:hypothetical protein PanWU01x14_170810 [Parasponia andersonii]
MDAFLQEQDASIRNLEYQVVHLATIINHPENTFHNNTDSTLKEKYYTTTTCSGLYDDEVIFELQEKEGDWKNSTMQSDLEYHVNINITSYEENPISKSLLMRKLRIKVLGKEFSCPQPLNQ